MPKDPSDHGADVLIIGAGAAGLAAAVMAAEQHRESRIVLLEGTSRPGSKLLLTGGRRCNLTNRTVTPQDFSGSNPHAIKKVLGAFTVTQTIEFFRSLGVLLHEEEGGKLFPQHGGAHAVRNALLGRVESSGLKILTRQKVKRIEQSSNAFVVSTSESTFTAPRILLTTGGCSYPSTGSDGSGYELARSCGHTIIPPTPALVPLVLAGGFHRGLIGISHDVELTLVVDGKRVKTAGSLLWTHFGVSGPAVLDISGHWLRGKLEGLRVEVTVNLLPGETAASLEQWLIRLASNHPRMSFHRALSSRMPARLAEAVLHGLDVDGTTAMAHLSRDTRRHVRSALVAWPLPVVDSRGYEHAEVTAGGVPLKEVNPATMESRICPGLFLAGEVLDVTGRVGGFNLQWAWSSAWVAARGLTVDNAALPRAEVSAHSGRHH
ncbi:MAG TPA: NAD(P)/FAD-dependent oxidoreductase [Phycisphaerae bacterium]|nr:NAD(P)/FAD-dependent oxidoreductase [Phycisphaerae bacterium]HRR84930.1 NAD(P)/FAD-dependent oxidoreductase [Phycisphaerae bacterium]